MFFFLMIRRPPRSTQSRSSAASDVYKRQTSTSSAFLEGPDYQLDASMFLHPDPEVFVNPPIPLGAIVEGRMESYFAHKPDAKQPGFISEVKDGKIVVFADRELYIDPDNPIYENRYHILLNAVDWLMDRPDTVSYTHLTLTTNYSV